MVHTESIPSLTATDPNTVNNVTNWDRIEQPTAGGIPGLNNTHGYTRTNTVQTNPVYQQNLYQQQSQHSNIRICQPPGGRSQIHFG